MSTPEQKVIQEAFTQAATNPAPISVASPASVLNRLRSIDLNAHPRQIGVSEEDASIYAESKADEEENFLVHTISRVESPDAWKSSMRRAAAAGNDDESDSDSSDDDARASSSASSTPSTSSTPDVASPQHLHLQQRSRRGYSS